MSLFKAVFILIWNSSTSIYFYFWFIPSILYLKYLHPYEFELRVKTRTEESFILFLSDLIDILKLFQSGC